MNRFWNPRWLLAGGFALLTATGAHAQEYPTKLVTVLVGYGPGSATDVLTRALLPVFQANLKQSVIVDNLAGASGTIGVQKMLNAHDGAYTLYSGAASDFILAPLQIPAAKYKAEDARLISATAFTQLVLVTRKGLDIKSVDELAAYLKSQGKPGLTYASSGIGSIFHLAMEQFQQTVSGTMVHVAYSGMSQLFTNLMGEQIDLALVPLVGPVVAMIHDGKIRALAVTGAKRNSQIPEVPAVDETQAMKGFYFDIWCGLYAPTGTPTATLQRLNTAFNEAQSSAEFRKFADVNGVSVLDKPMTLEQAEKFYREVTAQYRRLAQLVKLGGN